MEKLMSIGPGLPKRRFSLEYLNLLKKILNEFHQTKIDHSHPVQEVAQSITEACDKTIKKHQDPYQAVSEDFFLESLHDFSQAFYHHFDNEHEVFREIVPILDVGEHRLIEYLFYSSETVLSGLKQIKNYYSLMNPCHKLLINHESDPVKVHFYNVGNLSDYNTGLSMVCEIYWILHCIEKCFSPQQLEKVELGIEPQTNTLIIEKSLAKTKLQSRDKKLNRSLQQQGLKKVTEISGIDPHTVEHPLISRIVQEIQQTGLDKLPSIDKVSDNLGMSSRTLQRKLKDENTNFTEILSSIRSTMAKQLLLDNTFSVAEISQKLGFSEPSALNRAFKSWTGLSPVEYRKRHLEFLKV